MVIYVTLLSTVYGMIHYITDDWAPFINIV